MKMRCWILMAGHLALAAACGLAQTAAAPVRLDTIFTANNEKIQGKVIGLDAQNYKIQKPLPPAPNAPAGAPPMFATVTIPRTNVVRIEFAPDEARDRKLKEATPAQILQVEALWKQYEPWLAVPKSPAGSVGIAYGNVLLQAKNAAHAQKALEIFQKVEKESWNDEDLVQAKRGRLRGMIATGQAQEAIQEANELAKTSEDPAVLIEARYIMAEASNAAFRKLVEDNPRWEQDLLIVPQRNRLYAETLNLYLFPYLFYGSEVEPAARGLAGALGVYQFTGETKLAASTAQDLVELYPGTAHAAEARRFLDAQPKESTTQTTKNEK